MKQFKKLLLSVLILFLTISTVYLGSEVISMKKEITNLSQSTFTKEVTENKAGEPEVVQVSKSVNTDISDVYDKVKDSVVTVKTFVGTQLISSGSGVVYKSDAQQFFVVTNNHVITQGNKIEVILASGEALEAKLLGTDIYADLAVLNIKSDHNIKPMELGDSSVTKVGETVLAIGSPTGVDFSGSLAVGVISGKERSISVDLDNNGTPDWDMIMLQTDAAINPGNSGGALVNMEGQLIGINTIKIIGNNVEGMGFANPINEVINIVEQLETDGKVSRPSIGIMGRSMEELAFYRRYYTNSDIPLLEKGVYVMEVVPLGPAEKAGFKAGDVITKFDGHEIDQFKDFRAMLYQHKKGDRVMITIFRNNQELELEVVLN